MTERAWRLDPAPVHPASSERNEAAELTPGSDTGPMVSACGPRRSSLGRLGFVRQWILAVRTWAIEKFQGIGGRAARFEDVLHEFTAIIETADDPAIVEAALLRLARRIAAGVSDRADHRTGPVPRSWRLQREATTRDPAAKSVRRALVPVGAVNRSWKCRCVAARLSAAGSAFARERRGWLLEEGNDPAPDHALHHGRVRAGKAGPS